MNHSPSQRFQRTSNVNISTKNIRNSQSFKITQSKDEQKQKMYNRINFIKRSQGSPQINQLNQQAQHKISNLQKILQIEKSKRQNQFGQLFKMISSLKNGHKILKQKAQPKFVYKQIQFPMTPRARSRENDDDSQLQFKQQTYSPIYETVSKGKIKNIDKQSQHSITKSFQDFSIKSLQILLLKIQREAQYNNRNFSKINQQISSIKAILSHSNQGIQRPLKNSQILSQIQKYMRQSYATMKSYFVGEVVNMQQLIGKKIEQKIQERLKNLQQSKNTNNHQQLTQIKKILRTTNTHLQQSIKAIQQKTQKQIFVLNDIIQQKICYFKASLLEQVIKDNKQNQNKILNQMQKQKLKVLQIQEYNSQFFCQLQKTMENIQQKLHLAKSGSITNYKQDSQLKISQFKKLLQKEKDQYFYQITSSFDQKLNKNIQKLQKDIKIIQNKLFKLEESKLVIENIKFQSNPRKNNYLQKKQNNFIQNNQTQLSSTENWSRKIQMNDLSDQIKQKFQVIIELISENCSFLQTRNCSIEESMEQVILTLNDLVQKIKHTI